MALRAGEMAKPRHLEQLRAEIVEIISAHLAYPPFYDFRTGALRTRPIDREKVAEIEQFIGSANFTTIEQTSPTSPEMRRFIERLMLRYMDINPALATPANRRFLGSMRAQAARLASETHRRFTNHLNGQERDFGARRQAASWALGKHSPKPLPEKAERSNRLIEAGLQEPASARIGLSAKYPVVNPPAKSAPTPSQSSTQLPQASQSSNGLFGPFASASPAAAPVSAPIIPPAPPAQPAIPIEPELPGYTDLSDQPTGPVAAIMPAVGKPSPAPKPADAAMREVPPDLLNLYGAYLGDMEPEARANTPPAAPTRPASQSGAAASRAVSSAGRNDILIFYQLRYQIEAYVRWAVRSYNLPDHAGDPKGILNELRRSGFVDEADLRIVEGVYALTDRVTSQGQATLEDYRQAMMLYLLYHRSHLPS